MTSSLPRWARQPPSCSLPGQAAPTEPPGNITSPGGPVLKVAKGPVLDVG
jgi:hypothetical protein